MGQYLVCGLLCTFADSVDHLVTGAQRVGSQALDVRGEGGAEENCLTGVFAWKRLQQLVDCWPDAKSRISNRTERNGRTRSERR